MGSRCARSPIRRAGIESFGLPRSHLGLRPLPAGTFAGFPTLRPHRSDRSPCSRRRLLDLCRAFRALIYSWNTSRRPRAPAFLPLWIHGVYRPSTVSPRVCPLPARDKSRTFGPTVPTASSRSVHVVLPHLNGFLHTSRLRACCIPLPVLRFAGFLTSRSHPRFHSRKSLAKDGVAVAILPYAHTPRRIPLSRSRTVSPRPIPPCRYHSAMILRRDIDKPFCVPEGTLPTLIPAFPATNDAPARCSAS